MSYCGINHLDSLIFENLNSLQYLNLTRNSLYELPSNIFSHLSHSIEINLSGNKFRSDLNLKLNKTDVLDLSYNQISSIENLITQGNIKHLILSYNNIHEWSIDDIFNSNLIKIENVNLFHNKINIINKVMQISISSLQSIDIGDNPFDCNNCNIQEFQKFLNTTKTKINLNNIQCFQKDVLVINAEYPDSCKIKTKNIVNYKLVIGIPFSVISIIILVILLFLFYYRTEVTYLKHLLRVRIKDRNKMERLNCKFDVFVSYCKKDRDWVLETLLPALENPEDKYSLCLHERDFPLGSYIVENIVSHIEDSRRIVLVLTRSFIDSDVSNIFFIIIIKINKYLHILFFNLRERERKRERGQHFFKCIFFRFHYYLNFQQQHINIITR
jgi:hypothetical protein